jgi:YD repeat-containing protein
MVALHMKLKLITLIIGGSVAIMSCKKNIPNNGDTVPDPIPSVSIIPLKEIVIPELPSPYYHFEYNANGKYSMVAFANNLMRNEVIYDADGRISELRNSGAANKDTLRYYYDDAGKVIAINYSDFGGRVYVRVALTYDGNKLVQLVRRRILGGSPGYVVNKIMSFTYYADGNLKEITDTRPAILNTPEESTHTRFEQYDDKVNVDDFNLLHNDFFDDVWILPGVKLQKNNALKEIFTGPSSYIVEYTNTYNDKNYPLIRRGNVLITGGTNAGERFQTSLAYSYY